MVIVLLSAAAYSFDNGTMWESYVAMKFKSNTRNRKKFKRIKPKTTPFLLITSQETAKVLRSKIMSTSVGSR